MSSTRYLVRGTLGYVLRATLRLVVSRPYVAVTTTIHKSFKEAMAKMEKAESTSEFVGGCMVGAG